MAIEKEVKIKITSDGSDAQRGLNTIKGSFTELNAKVELAQKAFHAFQLGADGLFRVLDKGSAFIELKDAFDKLYGSANSLGQDGLGKLREATSGLIDDMTLLKKANAAAQAGLSPETFLTLARSAEALGDSIQKDAGSALEDLTDALIRGRTMALAPYGIKLDELGESGNKTADILGAIVTRAERVGGAVESSGDKVARLKNQWDSLSTTFAVAVASNKDLQGALDSVSKELASVNFQPIISGLSKFISLTVTATSTAIDGWTKFFNLFDGSAQKKFSDLNLEIADLEKRKAAVASDPSAWFGEKRIKGIQKLIDLREKEKKALQPLVDAEIQAKRIAVEKNSVTDVSNKLAAQATTLANNLAGAVNNVATSTKQAAANTQTLNDALSGVPDTPELIPATVIADTGAAVQRELEDSFQQSADFFADVFENAITGTTFDLEDALKRLAVGFASSLAASIAQSLGFSFGNVGGLQGLGGALAGSLWQGLGGKAVGSTLGSVFGGVAGAAGAAGVNAALVPAVPEVISATTGVGSGAIAGTAVAAGPPGWLVAAVVAAGSLLLPKIFDGIGKVFGKLFGGSQDPDELARRAFRKELSKTGLGEDLILPTVRGDVKLSQIDYKKFNQTFAGKDFGDQALGLTAPLAQVLTGGGKLGEDFALIFAQAVGNAQNYNEVIINTLSLMGKLGVGAGEAKDKFKELFLDGKVTLDQFTVGVQNLNFIAQEDLVGPNSVADAINALASAIDSPRVQLKALEFSFKEMAQLGIDTSAEIYAYLIDKWGPGVADVFKALTDAGIDTWQEIANASADQLVVIFNALKNLNVDMKSELSRTAKTVVTTFNDAGTKASSEFEKATDPVIKRLREIGDEAVKTGGVLDTVISQISSNLKGVDNKIGDTKTKASGISGTIPNNEFRA